MNQGELDTALAKLLELHRVVRAARARLEAGQDLAGTARWLCREVGAREAWIRDPTEGPGGETRWRQVERLFDDRSYDFVFHLAAEFGRWNGEDYYDTLWRSNAVGTKNLIRLQEAKGFRLVFSSSSESC